MSSALPSEMQAAPSSSAPVDLADADSDLDNRSSSLSDIEVDDVSDDDRDSISERVPPLRPALDVDSEAETERLDKSPLKQPQSASAAPSSADRTDASSKEAPLEHTSTHSTADKDAGAPSPARTSDDAPDSLASSGLGNLGKRKRQSPAVSPLSDVPIDEPSPKRAYTADKVDSREKSDDQEKTDDREKSDDRNEAVASEYDQEKPGDVAAPEAVEAPEAEYSNVRRGRFRRKGRRKGRRHALGEREDGIDASDTPAHDAEEQPEEEVDEDEEQAQAEELARRKIAGGVLMEIEKDFTQFREQYLREQLQQVEHELALLNQDNCIHPEYLAQLKSVDERLNDKLQYENNLLRFNLTSTAIQTVAQRQQLHSQYKQDVREIKDMALENCNKVFYALQRERRRYGTADRNSLIMYNPNRQEQINAQRGYNLEVSILSGMAKHVGFPAAPDMSPLTAQQKNKDLEVYGINRNPVAESAPSGSVPAGSAGLRPQPAQKAAEEFWEQTPWANPSHPAHSNPAVPRFHAQTALGSSPLAPRVRDPTAGKGKGPAYLAPNAPSATRPPAAASHANDAPAAAVGRASRGLRDTERIQTTHSSSLTPPPTMIKPAREPSSSIRPKAAVVGELAPTEQTLAAAPQTGHATHAFHHSIAGRMNMVGGAPLHAPVGMGKPIKSEALGPGPGPGPGRAAIAPVGGNGGRYAP